MLQAKQCIGGKWSTEVYLDENTDNLPLVGFGPQKSTWLSVNDLNVQLKSSFLGKHCGLSELNQVMRTCMGLSVLGAVVFSDEVSSSRQNISSWVWSAEKITWKYSTKPPFRQNIDRLLLCQFENSVSLGSIAYLQWTNTLLTIFSECTVACCSNWRLSAPAVAERQSAESSKNFGGRSWPSWGKEAA